MLTDYKPLLNYSMVNPLLQFQPPFEHTKYPSIEGQVNGMIKDQEEALAAHELAR